MVIYIDERNDNMEKCNCDKQRIVELESVNKLLNVALEGSNDYNNELKSSLDHLEDSIRDTYYLICEELTEVDKLIESESDSSKCEKYRGIKYGLSVSKGFLSSIVDTLE